MQISPIPPCLLMLLKLLLPVPPPPSSSPVPDMNSARDIWRPFSSGLKPLLGKWWSTGHRTASHACQGGVRSQEMPCIGVVLAHHMFNCERGHRKAQVVQLRRNGKIPPFFLFLCMSSPSLPNRDLACECTLCAPISVHTKGSPFLAGLSQNQMCGNCNPHDITILVCGYPDISVITYQTDGEVSTFSKKKTIFYGTS